MSRELTAQDEVDANNFYGMALWYGWGRLDSGTYMAPIRARLDAMKFAAWVKDKRREFLAEKVVSFESIQGLWERWVAETLRPEWDCETNDYSLSDCVYWDKPGTTECAGPRVGITKSDIVVCEKHYNHPPSTVFDRPPGNVYRVDDL